MKITKYIIIVLTLCTATQAMAQDNQDHWLKRNWDNMIARYNIYFNAQQKLDAGVSSLTSKHKDNFNDFLPIYPYGTKEDASSMRTPMEETMKKASKVIQNKPRSKWVDNAYFIIGQTQFFSGDYYSAIETFQFVNNSFTEEDIKAMSQLWLMKAYIQQDKLDDAEAIYGLLKKIKSNDVDFLSHLNLSAGDLMVKQGKYQLARELLTKGLRKLNDRTLKYRTHFVLGQLYLEAEEFSKANKHFEKVLRMNAPYEYVFQSNLGMAKSASQAGGQGTQKTIKYLKRMLDDDKNIDYFDQIYFELAKLEFSQKNEERGLEYMRKSAHSESSNNTQQTKTYLFLADYYFEKREYSRAQSYYDSTVAVLPEEFLDSDKIRAKHSVLSKLIENIVTIRMQDSLLALSNMDRADLDKKINRRIEADIEQERLAKEEDAIRAEQARLDAMAGGGASKPLPNSSPGGTWYFYNSTSVARGENDFKRVWGDRKHGDFWRYLNKSLMKGDITEEESSTEENEDPETYISSQDEEQNEVLKDIDAEKRKYYASIPFSATAKLVANKKIQLAYLGLGKIYFDELKEYTQSFDNLNTLLNRYPRTVHKPEALFYLSKTSTQLNDSSSADKYARMIAEEYPETVYNSVLNNKEIKEDNADKEVLKKYELMYEAFERGNDAEVERLKKDIDQNYAGNSIQGKIDYLYALMIGRTKGKVAYLEELEVIKEAYAGTEIGERAAFTIRTLSTEQKTESSIFSNEKSGVFYYVITGSTDQKDEVEIQINNYNQQFFADKNLQVKSILFDGKQLFYIKQFANEKLAELYHTEMKANGQFLQNAGLSASKVYMITETNFKKLITTKKEGEYLNFVNKRYK